MPKLCPKSKETPEILTLIFFMSASLIPGGESNNIRGAK